MNTFPALLTAPWVEPLGRALLYFLWEGAVLGVLAWIVLRFTHHRTPNIRYLLAALLMLALPVAPVITFWILSDKAPAPMQKFEASWNPTVAEPVPAEQGPSPVFSGPPKAEAPQPILFNAPHPSASAVSAVSTTPSWFAHTMEVAAWWMVPFWLAGVLAMGARLGLGWLRIQFWKRAAYPAADFALLASFRRLTKKFNLGARVRLLISQTIPGPVTLGWVRPAVLVPAQMLTGLPQELLEALLAHELAHIARHDYLANLVQSAIEVVLFYHPAVWWLGRQLREIREECCDELAVRACGDRLTYARALESLAELQLAAEPAAAATGGNLFARIARIVGRPPTAPTSSARHLAGILILVGFAAGLFAVLSPGKLQAQAETSKASSASPAKPDSSPRFTVELSVPRLKPQAPMARRPSGTVLGGIQTFWLLDDQSRETASVSVSKNRHYELLHEIRTYSLSGKRPDAFSASGHRALPPPVEGEPWIFPVKSGDNVGPINLPGEPVSQQYVVELDDCVIEIPDGDGVFGPGGIDETIQANKNARVVWRKALFDLVPQASYQLQWYGASNTFTPAVSNTSPAPVSATSAPAADLWTPSYTSPPPVPTTSTEPADALLQASPPALTGNRTVYSSLGQEMTAAPTTPPAPTATRREADLAVFNTAYDPEKLIDALVNVSTQTENVSTSRGNGYDPLPPPPSEMRQIVAMGTSIVPALLAHLTDSRETKLVITNPGLVPKSSPMFGYADSMGSMLFGDEYQPRYNDSARQPAGVTTYGQSLTQDSAGDTYTVRVGDLCYVLLGQIVGRNLVAVRYQNTASAVINSPVHTPALAAAARQDWGDLKPATPNAPLEGLGALPESTQPTVLSISTSLLDYPDDMKLPDDPAKIRAYLDTQQNTETITTPTITAQAGHEANVSVGTNGMKPAGTTYATQPLGVNYTITWQWSGDKIDFSLKASLSHVTPIAHSASSVVQHTDLTEMVLHGQTTLNHPTFFLLSDDQTTHRSRALTLLFTVPDPAASVVPWNGNFTRTGAGTTSAAPPATPPPEPRGVLFFRGTNTPLGSAAPPSTDNTIHAPSLNDFLPTGIKVSRVSGNLSLGSNSLTLSGSAKKTEHVNVLGEVKQPGFANIPSDGVLTLWQALRAAGYFTQQADLERVMITHNDPQNPSQSTRQTINVQKMMDEGREPDMVLQPGDFVNVPSKTDNKDVVTVTGEVRQPLILPLNGNTSLRILEVLLQAGWTEWSNKNNVTLIRYKDGVKTTQTIDVGKIIETGDLTDNILLQPGDTIIVDRKWMSFQ